MQVFHTTVSRSTYWKLGDMCCMQNGWHEHLSKGAAGGYLHLFAVGDETTQVLCIGSLAGKVEICKQGPDKEGIYTIKTPKNPKPWNMKGFQALLSFCGNNRLKKWRRRGFPWQDLSWFQVCCQSSCQGPQSKWFEAGKRESRVQVWEMNVPGGKAMFICIPLYIIFGYYI